MMTNSPEPMSLGSPTQSPSGGIPGGSSNYLPQFLLGDPMNQRHHTTGSQSGRGYWPNASATTHSPPRNSNLIHNHHLNHTHHYGGGPSGSSLSRNYSLNAYDVKLNLNPATNYIDKIEPGGYGTSGASSYSPHSERSQTNLISSSSNGSQVPGAPPVNRLVDILNKPTFNAGANNTSLLLNTPNESRVKFNLDYYNSGAAGSSENLVKAQNDLRAGTGLSDVNVNRLSSPPSPTQIDPFYAYGETIKMDEKLDETWITVFGFPQSATSYVLQEFSTYGQIVKYTPNAQGNWLHIKYQTKLQAQKALSKNGKVLSNSLMIGVMPCIDKMVMNVTSPVKDQSVLTNGSVCENVPTSPTSNVTGLIGNKSSLGRNFSNPTRLDRSQSLRTGVRPLGQFNRNLDPNSTNDGSSRMPKKNTNVISKAMEFMFGW